MHTVIARLVYRWVTFFLVLVLVGLLMAGALRAAERVDSTSVESGAGQLATNRWVPPTGPVA